MPVTRLNHAVLYVSDVRRSVDFYWASWVSSRSTCSPRVSTGPPS